MACPYEPEFSSPLNPRRQTPPRPRAGRAGRDVSLAQRLQRHRGAEAWRSHKLLLLEARGYEVLLGEAIASRETCLNRPRLRDVPDAVGAEPERKRERDRTACRLRVLDLSFFAPRRLVLAMEMVRLSVGGWLAWETPW
ncbi:hypothetical protein ED733_008144 [Metarhizium rileyi]|uniref:Uncharacterized protein n=1 Tax=Metarhizium rileyi (strain RCEF 4871) TaxID=1649241 RepID=A0A5C6GJZ8_METRR|nr:hypothetical protein ED733_008144 [Metarhizium rileyi]